MGQTMAREVMAGSPQTASATDLAAAGSVTVLAGYSNPCPRETGPDGLTCSTDSRVTWPASPQTPEVPEPPAVLPHAVRPSARTPAARAPVTCRDALRYLFMLVRRIPEAGGFPSQEQWSCVTVNRPPPLIALGSAMMWVSDKSSIQSPCRPLFRAEFARG